MCLFLRSIAPLCYEEFKLLVRGNCRFFGDVIFGDVKCVHVTSSQVRVVHLNRMSWESICYNLSNGAAVVYQLQLWEVSSCLCSTVFCVTMSHPELHTYFNGKKNGMLYKKTRIKCRIKIEPIVGPKEDFTPWSERFITATIKMIPGILS